MFKTAVLLVCVGPPPGAAPLDVTGASNDWVRTRVGRSHKPIAIDCSVVPRARFESAVPPDHEPDGSLRVE